ncbi:uncharacterized protein [Pyrus communis]|uniref:uncharacterized protein n=1 Tax=Pyrus communis TaxID=23211 RepID=UPI0035BFF1AA
MAMPHLISANQLTFVAGRQIQDNILVVHKILHSLNQQSDGDEVSLAMKLDMVKAYDRVEWSFLFAMMGALGFPLEFCQRVVECITTVMEKRGALHGVRVIPGGLSISHLFFVDAAVVFYKANETEVQDVMEVLRCYAEASGQVINREKSSLYFGANCERQQWRKIALCTWGLRLILVHLRRWCLRVFGKRWRE